MVQGYWWPFRDGILQNCKNLPLYSPLFWLSLKKIIFVRIFLAKLIPNLGVMTWRHFRTPVSFTQEYIRGCSNYVMCSRRVCVSFVVHARRNVRQICWETTMKRSGKQNMRVHPGLKVRKSPRLRKRTKILMAADRAANNFSRMFCKKRHQEAVC